MPRTIIRALSYALPRRYAEEDLAVIQGKWAIAFFVSVFLLCQATDAPRGTKVKGFLKYADSLTNRKKIMQTFYSTARVSYYYRTLGTSYSNLQHLVFRIYRASHKWLFSMFITVSIWLCNNLLSKDIILELILSLGAKNLISYK